jgi:outer membrane protein insertion porin family
LGAKGSGADGGFGGVRAHRTWFPLGTALVLILLSAGRIAAQEAVGPRILSIRFEGNDHLSEGKLRDQMRLRQPAWWKPFRHPVYPGPDYLASDLRSVLFLSQESGYTMARVTEAKVTYNEKGNGVRILIRIEEGPLVRMSKLLLRGADPVTIPKIEKAIDLKPGDPLSWTRLTATRDAAAKVYSDRGYALAGGELVVRHAGDSAEVVLDLVPGPLVHVDSVRVSGLSRARRGMVMRELTLRCGSLLKGKELLTSRQRLLSTGVFRRARLLPQFPDSTKPLANLMVDVEERKNGWVGAGVGYSSADQARLFTEWGLRDISGMGRRLGVTGNLYYALASHTARVDRFRFREGLIQVEYQEPWLFGTRTNGVISPYIRWVQEVGFHQRTLGYNLSLRRDLNRTDRVSLGVQDKGVATTQRDVIPTYNTRFLNLDLIGDSRDNAFNPANGYYWETMAEYAGGFLGGTNQFDRLTLTGQTYRSPQKGWVLASRLKLGTITPIGLGPIKRNAPGDTLRLSHIPWEERFRVGGGTSIRGYPEDLSGQLDANGQSIGGLMLFLANLEVRFPLVSIVSGGLFLDMGNVWTDARDITPGRFINGFRSRKYNPQNVTYGMGLGLRVMTAVGPFRIDYGFKVGSGRAPGEGPGKLHVALGQAF